MTEGGERHAGNGKHGLNFVAVGTVLREIEGVLVFNSLEQTEESDRNLFVAPLRVDETEGLAEGFPAEFMHVRHELYFLRGGHVTGKLIGISLGKNPTLPQFLKCTLSIHGMLPGSRSTHSIRKGHFSFNAITRNSRGSPLAVEAGA